MPIDITTHPDYAVAAAKYNAEKAAASAQGDETALAKADSEWSNARLRMSNDQFVRQEAEQTRTVRLAQIKSDFPDVPESVYTSIPDLEQAAKVAGEMQDVIKSRSAQGSWGAPPGGGGQQAPPANDSGDVTVEELAQREQRDPETGHFPTVMKMMDDISPEVLRKGALALNENKALQEMSLEPIVSRMRMGRRQK